MTIDSFGESVGGGVSQCGIWHERCYLTMFILLNIVFSSPTYYVFKIFIFCQLIKLEQKNRNLISFLNNYFFFFFKTVIRVLFKNEIYSWTLILKHFNIGFDKANVSNFCISCCRPKTTYFTATFDNQRSHIIKRN